MDQRERQVIDELFGKLGQVERQAPQRDREAEEHIRQQIAQMPAAPYYMAQAMLVQEQALGSLQGRIQDLERQLAERPAAGGGGGFLSGLFGGGQPTTPPPASGPPPRPTAVAPYAAQPGGGPWMQSGMGGGAGYGGSPWARPMGGGGFLAGAMQTAVGVAGGVLVAEALTSAFDHGTAGAADLAHEAGFGGAAAEEPLTEPAPEPQDAGYQDAGYEPDLSEADMGGDFGEEV
jgi:hypothetical protein